MKKQLQPCFSLFSPDLFLLFIYAHLNYFLKGVFSFLLHKIYIFESKFVFWILFVLFILEISTHLISSSCFVTLAASVIIDHRFHVAAHSAVLL